MRLLRLHEGLSDYVSIIFQSEGLALKYFVDSLLQQEYRSQSLELNVESDFSLYYRLNVMILTRKINFLIQRQSYVS